MSWNQTETIFSLVNSKSKINGHIGKTLQYLNSHSIDNYLAELETNNFAAELERLEKELKSDLEKQTDINEKNQILQYNYDTCSSNNIQMNCFNQEQLYANYKHHDLYKYNQKAVRSSDEYKCSHYPIVNSNQQIIKQRRYFDTTNKIWFHFEKCSAITSEDIYALSSIEYSFRVSGIDLVKKNFSTCLIENLINDYDIFPTENILRLCLVDFETICDEQYGLPSICIDHDSKLYVLTYNNSIHSYIKDMKLVEEGYYLDMKSHLYRLVNNSWTFPITKTQSQIGLVLSPNPYQLQNKDLDACIWISLCFNVDSELLDINKIGLMAENTEYLYFGSEELVIISCETLTYYIIVLDSEYRDYQKFTSLLNNTMKDLDVRGVCLNQISDLKLQIDYNVNTQEKISFTVGYGGFDILQISGGNAKLL